MLLSSCAKKTIIGAILTEICHFTNGTEDQAAVKD